MKVSKIYKGLNTLCFYLLFCNVFDTINLHGGDVMQRYFAKDYKNKLILEDSDIHHIKNVMRMKIGDTIEVVFDNKLYICSLCNMEPIELNIDCVSDKESKLDLDITIAVALVKEQKMDLILQKLTELGVNRIIPVSMERSIVKLDDTKFNKKKIRWEAICKEASEQSKRTNIPIIENVMSIKELSKMEADFKLVASTKEKSKMLNYYLQKIDNCAKIILVVGPEGGISDREEAILNDNDFESISFGNLILRVETAAIYAASIFNYYSSMR